MPETDSDDDDDDDYDCAPAAWGAKPFQWNRCVLCYLLRVVAQ
jgi:hypothetical protein